MDLEAPQSPSPEHDPPEIPDKLFFRIGEVSQLLGLEAYVVRFWEGEFRGIAPKKSGTGRRLYRRKDVELLLRIKQLLYEKRYTIEGARQLLQAEAKASAAKVVVTPQVQQQLFLNDPLPGIRKELESILQILKT